MLLLLFGGLFVERLFFVCVFRGRGVGDCLSTRCLCFRGRGVGRCLSIGVCVLLFFFVCVCVLERGEWGAVYLQFQRVGRGLEGICCLSDKG